VSSPTVSLEAVFLTSIIDNVENREIATVGIPGAFMHVDIDEEIHMRIDGPLVDFFLFQQICLCPTCESQPEWVTCSFCLSTQGTIRNTTSSNVILETTDQ
jgi:hypothetical protein